MTYREEFPDFEPETLPAIPTCWTDISWRNDACPTFETNTGFHVMVDYLDAERRELPDLPRFCVVNHGLEGSTCLLATDDWTEVLAFLQEDVS